ncbi:hypothetical protein SAMN04487857_113134 [Pseudomonas sp. ok272]|uniref:hypothetical protein n=1 Tax=unclassified Pseudomonas TaxID=196821 RepID=UPI0008C0C0C1|nr:MULTISPECIES: hypothetical protein [unclassified Pseudomonas]SEN31684.1 hypothetical protein SAMN04487857_113134 [Pseudomonas sp. ok272]SFN19063.1 hypothetical protein SAMN04487858_11436 [Pseudomonas sp. ok602]
MPKDTLSLSVTAPKGLARPAWVALIATLLAAWLIAKALLMPQGGWSDAITFGLIVAGLVLTWRVWLGKTSARLGLGLVAMVAVLALLTALPFNPVKGAGSFEGVILLLLGIGQLRAYLDRQNIKAQIERALSHPWVRRSAWPIFMLYSALAFFLSLATVPIVGSLTRSTRLNHLYHLRLAMRAVCATMFIAPTTAGAAAVSAMFPGLGWSQALLAGLPLALMCLLLTRSEKEPALAPMPLEQDGAGHGLLLPLVIFIGVIVGGKLLLGLATVTTVALAVSITGGVSLLVNYGIGQLATVIGEGFERSSAEILLFIACGTLQVALAAPQTVQVLGGLDGAGVALLSAAPLQLLVILGLLPLLTVVGVHPMILFAAAFPVLHPLTPLPVALEYQAWMAMFVISQLISPVSISAVTAAASVHESPWRVSIQSHGGFALAFAVGGVGYLWAMA